MHGTAQLHSARSHFFRRYFGAGRRVRVVGLLALACSLGLLLSPHVVSALSYVNSSPAGPAFPEWDGGDTELEFADVDADGNVDFVTIGDHGSPYINTDQHGLMVYFGDGAGGWSIHMEGNFGYGGVAIGDVNNDGLLDAGYAMHHNYSGTDFGNQLIEVALGDGSGTAWLPWDDGLATGGESYGMFATDLADIDVDGDLDLVSNSFGASNGVHVYRNNGDGTWTQTWARTGGNAQAHVCFGDVNGDGYPDVAASYQYGTIFLGDGGGGFTPADTGLPGAGTTGLKGVALGDIDGDGCADLAFTRSGGVFVYVWRATQWVSASAGLPASGNYEVTHLWDMNLDGWVDVAALGEGDLTVWLGDGTGQWVSAGTTYIGPGLETAAFQTGGDVDHNGYPDIVCVQDEGSFPSYQNHLYVFRESSVPAARATAFQFPRGSETFFAGSVQTIRWSAVHVGPEVASIDLELSRTGPTGPWLPIAQSLPDGGHFQWRVAGPASGAAHIRVTLTQAGESVSAISRAFEILPCGSADAGEDRTWTGGRAALLTVEPNPVTSTAHIALDRAVVMPAVVRISDACGRQVRTMAMAAERLVWDGRDARGVRLPAGTYWVQLDGSQASALRIVVLR